MNVLVLYTLPPPTVAAGRTTGEFDLQEAARAVAAALPGAACAAVCGRLNEVVEAVVTHRPEVVFNLCEAPLGRPSLEAPAAAVLEWLGVRFTGSRSEALAACRRKDWTKAILARAGVPVPAEEGFPCIVKPADEDGSAGIDADSVCQDEAALRRARARLPGRIVVERFLPGREFAVSLWGRAAADHVSIGEFQFRDGLRLNTYRSKWDVSSDEFACSPLAYDTNIDPSLRGRIIDVARAAWGALDLRGYARIDIRLDENGAPHVLDVNPNPELSPGAGIHRAALEAGWTWEQFVQSQVEWA
jgi:D-alanine-D-alanine ligase